MEVVWQQGPVTSAAVVAALESGRGWAANTVRTMLARLVKKKGAEDWRRGKSLPLPRSRSSGSLCEDGIDTLARRVLRRSHQSDAPLLLQE